MIDQTFDSYVTKKVQSDNRNEDGKSHFDFLLAMNG